MSTVLLLHCNDAPDAPPITTFVDATGRHTCAGSGYCKIASAGAKFGISGGLSIGNGGSLDTSYMRLTGNLSDFAFGTGDFTIDMWLYHTVTPSVLGIVLDFRPSGGSGAYPALYFDTANFLRYYVNSADVIVSGAAVSQGTWNHIALTRASGSTKLFVNGTQTGSTYSDATNYTIGADAILFGLPIGYSTNAYFDEVRILKGEAAWTSNFTPPTAAYTDPLTGVSGTLTATEAGNTANLSATTQWLAALAASETTDTANLAGLVGRLGTLAVSEIADASNIAAAIFSTATLAAIEAADISNLSASARWLASLVATEAPDRAVIIEGEFETVSEMKTHAVTGRRTSIPSITGTMPPPPAIIAQRNAAATWIGQQ